jgi:hypothetical protein
MCDGCDRLVILLRLVERRVGPFGVLEDDAALDASFGPSREAAPDDRSGVRCGLGA